MRYPVSKEVGGFCLAEDKRCASRRASCERYEAVFVSGVALLDGQKQTQKAANELS